jgi:hypothetical protein
MDDLTLINNTSGYRTPAPQSVLQGPNVMQPAVVYSRLMLRTIELAESDYVFDSLATERTMPSNNGANEIQFKRYLSLAAHTQPLVEGIPPASDKGAMVAIKGSCKSYGRVMKFTDKVDWAIVDPIVSEYTRQLSLKIPETKDLLAQEALLAESGVFYAQSKKVYANAGDPDTLVIDDTKPTVSHITHLDTTCNPTLDEFRKIVLSMEAAKVRPGTGGNFQALISSAVMFDLITDRRVKEYMKFENTGSAYKNDVVIDLFSLVFKKAKTIKTDNTFIDGDGILRYIYHDAANGINVVTDKPWSEMAANDDVTKVTLSTGAEATVKFSTVSDGDYDVLNVHHSFVLGEEALFRIGVEGHTAPQFIKKELGSAGTADPLNQRQSIGWKIDSLGYKVCNPDAVVDYMSIPSQYRINVNARPDMKNQFTDYYYGYVDAAGNYFHPDQVIQTVESGAVKYYVRGTTTEVTAVKMASLVKPVNGGRIDANGKKAVVIGDVPTTQYALASNKAIRFLENQVVLHTDSKYYSKGLAGTASAEVVKLPVTVANTVVYKADGTGTENATGIVESNEFNKTGDPRID